MGVARESDDVLLAAASRDPEAFARFYRRHAGAVLAYLAYRARNADEVVDLTAETFAAAFEASRRYRPAYIRGDGTLCNSAAPAGERLTKPRYRQCRQPLAIVNALDRYGAAVYLSDPNPLRERGPRNMAVFGLARADATAVTIISQKGGRSDASLSSPWATAVRRLGDLAGIHGGLRQRLELLPRRMRLRSYITSIRLPPRPTDGRGLELEVRLSDGRLLRTAAP